MSVTDRAGSSMRLAAAVGCLALLTSAASAQRTITSSDGAWTANVDEYGQVVDFYPTDQPDLDNVFETVVFEAGNHNNMLSRMVQDHYTVTSSIDGPDHTFTRLEKNQAPLSIEIDNYMISGATGGVRVEIRAINKGSVPAAVKLFYYCDFDISATTLDDEATVVTDPDSGGALALEQTDAAGDPPKPLWFGACPVYKSWQIDGWPTLRSALITGVFQLTNADGTAPGPADHTMALSGEQTGLLPGQGMTFYAAIGAPGINGCPQAPACPWDCADPPDKMVSVTDFLAILAQWGGPGSCDFDGGGVGVTDFLKMLSAWGPCPMPINDECLTSEQIDKVDANGTQTVSFDMYGATVSPEPYQCIDEEPTHKDIWYCLTNATGERIGVSITSNLPLLIEVNEGCVCPPGPLLACGDGQTGTEQFPMDDGAQVMIRVINWLDLPNDELKGSIFIQNKPIPPHAVNFFRDRGLFDDEIIAQGKFSKAFWAFKPDLVQLPAPIILIDDPLDIDTHSVNAPGVWDDGNFNFWPDEVDNVRFSSNLNPGGTLQPGGEDALAYLKPGTVPEIDNNALTEYVLGSFDIISGPPAGDNHTALAFELVSWDENGIDDLVRWHISVYDKADALIGLHKFEMMQPVGQVFLGIVTKAPGITIGRVDIWDETCSYEGISSIELYQPEASGAVNFFDQRILFAVALATTGKTEKFEWDFNPHNGSSDVPPITDPLDIDTHDQNEGDPWTGPGGEDLWPITVDNVQFSSNMTPQESLTPRGYNGLTFLHPGNWTGIDNNALIANANFDSFDIISGAPAGDNHTAFALEVFSDAPTLPTEIHITVYDKTDAEMGQYSIDYQGGKAFVGILTKDPADTIGRIDIWDENNGFEGVSIIQAFWQDMSPAPSGPRPQTLPFPE